MDLVFGKHVPLLGCIVISYHYLCLQVKESVKLRQIMQTILTLGNALNQGTARGISMNSYLT
jgi:hypothetical protein